MLLRNLIKGLKGTLEAPGPASTLGKGIRPLPQHGSARAWGQEGDISATEPPSPAPPALSLHSLLVGAVPSANPPLNMVHTRLPPADPDHPESFPRRAAPEALRCSLWAHRRSGGPAPALPAPLFRPAPLQGQAQPPPKCLARKGFWACPSHPDLHGT